jgi:hypothetical protein
MRLKEIRKAKQVSHLEPIGYIPPAEAEANYWRQLDEKAETDHST